MIPKNPFQNERVERLIRELRRMTTQMESLLRKLPTTNARVLADLFTLSTQIESMASEDFGGERNSMLLDQAKRQALFQRQRYTQIAHSGRLRNT